MKTAYVISPGLQRPDDFQWRNAPVILSQPGLWEAMKTMPAGIVFRVRTEQNVGDRLNGSDRIESAVGIIDSTTRWRACLVLIRIALNGLRLPEIAEPCWAVFNMLTTKHPATIPMQERQQHAMALRAAMEKVQENDGRAAFESSCAAMCIRLAFCENDTEVAHIVPYMTAYMINAGEYHDDRAATVEVLASSIFLAESFGRLFEKASDWIYGKLPATPGQTPPAERPIRPQQEAEDDDED